MAQWYLSMDTRFFIHISRDQPSAHEFTKYMGQQSLVPLLESGVSAPRMLLGPCSKISACWHHPFRPQTACEPSLNTLTPGATGGPWAAKCTDDWREAWLSQRAKDARTKWLTREAADGSKPTNGPKTRELSQRAEDTRGWRDWRRPLRQFEINVR